MEVGSIKSGGSFSRDKLYGFKGGRENAKNTLQPNKQVSKIGINRLQCLHSAALALNNIPVPNVADHGRKIIELSKIFEDYVESV